MLATSEMIREAAQWSHVTDFLPRWRELPIYQSVKANDLSKFPIIGKRELRKNFPQNFLRPGQRLEALLEKQTVELEHTSGSSEERVAVLFGRDWWNWQERRILRLNRVVAGVLEREPQARRVAIVPPVCNGLVCFSNYTAKSARTVDATLFVNQARIPFLQTEKELWRMAEEILEWSPQFLDVDPVHGAWFALFCERKGIRFPSVKFILCSYEFMSEVHRRVLRRAFGVPVFNLYGATETGHLLMENDQGEMKAGLSNVLYEVIGGDAGGVGDLVVTTLTNYYMPLVRYRVGDLVERCEQPYGTNFLVHGRARDALRRRDGRRVTTLELDRCFAGVNGIIHYQLRQGENGDCDFKFISDHEPPSAEELRRVTDKMQDLLQLQNGIAITAVDKLPPLPSGKFRLTCRG